MHKNPDHTPSEERDYQDREIRLGVLVASLVVIGLVTVAAFIGMRKLFELYDTHMYQKAKPSSPLAVSRQLPPETGRLQVDEKSDLARLRAEETRLLSTYGWVDEAQGLARIPIEEAMDLALKQGFPVRDLKRSETGEGSSR